MVDPRLHQALEAARRRDWEAALGPLAEMWPETGDAGIADAIEGLVGLVRRPYFEGTRNQRHAAIVRAVDGADPADAGRVVEGLRRLTSTQMIDVLMRLKAWPHPTFAGLAWAWAPQPPVRVNKVWTRLFWMVVWMPDRRGPGRLAELRERYPTEPDAAAATTSHDWHQAYRVTRTQERLAAALEGLPELDEKNRPAVTEILARIEAARPKVGASEAELLERIYADPTDDGARLVYADLLQSREDPRGEFIVLQYLDAPNTAQRRRAAHLLRQHRSEWLGPLDPLLFRTGLTFEKGFLSRARLKPAGAVDFASAAQDPRWNTLTDVEIGPLDWGRGARWGMEELVLSGRLAALHTVRGVVTADELRRVLEQVPGLRRLALAPHTDERWAGGQRRPAVPAGLRHVEMSVAHARQAHKLDWVLAVLEGHALDSFTIYAPRSTWRDHHHQGAGATFVPGDAVRVFRRLRRWFPEAWLRVDAQRIQAVPLLTLEGGPGEMEVKVTLDGADEAWRYYGWHRSDYGGRRTSTRRPADAVAAALTQLRREEVTGIEADEAAQDALGPQLARLGGRTAS